MSRLKYHLITYIIPLINNGHVGAIILFTFEINKCEYIIWSDGELWEKKPYQYTFVKLNKWINI
jgi:hypothetical protein